MPPVPAVPVASQMDVAVMLIAAAMPLGGRVGGARLGDVEVGIPPARVPVRPFGCHPSVPGVVAPALVATCSASFLCRAFFQRHFPCDCAPLRARARRWAPPPSRVGQARAPPASCRSPPDPSAPTQALAPPPQPLPSRPCRCRCSPSYRTGGTRKCHCPQGECRSSPAPAASATGNFFSSSSAGLVAVMLEDLVAIYIDR